MTEDVEKLYASLRLLAQKVVDDDEECLQWGLQGRSLLNGMKTRDPSAYEAAFGEVEIMRRCDKALKSWVLLKNWCGKHPLEYHPLIEPMHPSKSGGEA